MHNLLEYFFRPIYVHHQASVQPMYLKLAQNLDDILEDDPEKTVALRKLLESFDAAMRAAE